MMIEPLRIRTLNSLEDYRQAEQAQRVGWQLRDETQVVPLHVLLTAQKNGGLAAGAFDAAGQMVGFLFGFLGLQHNGQLKHCSHLMCIDPTVRAQGIGARLKRFQADYVRAQRIDLITWTFDPLEGANAMLNIGRLRAVTNTFYPNLYGDFDDALNSGLPTDRLEVEWWINSARVTDPPPIPATRQRLSKSGAVLLNPSERIGALRQPGQQSAADFMPTLAEATPLLLEVPATYQAIKRESMAVARDWRRHSGQWFTLLFAQGYLVTDFISERAADPGDSRNFYVLTRQIL